LATVVNLDTGAQRMRPGARAVRTVAV